MTYPAMPMKLWKNLNHTGLATFLNNDVFPAINPRRTEPSTSTKDITPVIKESAY